MLTLQVYSEQYEANILIHHILYLLFWSGLWGKSSLAKSEGYFLPASATVFKSQRKFGQFIKQSPNLHNMWQNFQRKPKEGIRLPKIHEMKTQNSHGIALSKYDKPVQTLGNDMISYSWMVTLFWIKCPFNPGHCTLWHQCYQKFYSVDSFRWKSWRKSGFV